MKKILFLFYILAILSCSEKELLVPNQNDPATAQVLATPEDLENVVKGAALTSYSNFQDFGFRMTVSVMSDYNTSSWGNAGMQDMSSEPRNLWNNSKAYGASFVTQQQYNEAYGVIHQLNNVLVQLEGEAGTALGEDKIKVEAFARFLLGLNYGSIGNIFNKAVLVQPSDVFTPENYAFSDYQEIIAYALENIDQAISLGNTATALDYTDWFNGVHMDKAYFIQLANSYAARILAGSPRNKAENEGLDWNRVKDYATNGIQEDFVVMNDGDTWIALGQCYTNRSGWTRVDLRVINMMAPTYPARFPNNGAITSLPEATGAIDQRLSTDFTYIASVPFRPNRGYYHFSNYQFTRLDPLNLNLTGPAPDFMAAENNMLLAEANARTGGLATAISILNDSERITRGGLPEVASSASSEEVLAAIFHERTIEIFGTGANFYWYDMRRRDMLQKGSLLHFPVPGSELEVLIEDNYSFGGDANGDGINTSNGGWF